MSETPNPIIVGYTVERLPDYRQDLHLQVPASYETNPEKRQAWLEKAYAGFAEECGGFKLTGQLSSVYAVDPSNQRVFSECRASKSNLATAFMHWLLEHYYFGDYAKAGMRRSVCFYGFDPKPLLRLTGVGALREGASEVPVSLWYMNDECLDPVEMLLETEMKKIAGIVKVLAQAPGLQQQELPPDYQYHQDAKLDAQLAAALCTAYQLLPHNQSIPLSLVAFPPAETSEDPAEETPAEQVKKKRVSTKAK